MSRETEAKGIVSIIVLVICYLYDSIGVLLVATIFAMCIDYITGVICAYKAKELNSSKGLWGIVKKVSYMCMVVLGYLFDLVIIYVSEKAGMEMSIAGAFGVLTTAWLFGNEGISILENLAGIGVPVPKFMVKGLSKFKDTIEADE